MTKIGIVVLNYNTKKEIEDCLESIGKLKKNDFTVFTYLVDNDSSDKSFREVVLKFKDLKLTENKENLGFSGGNNVGVKQALKDNCDWVLILNPDTEVDQNLLVEFLKVANQDSSVGIVGPKIYFAKGYEFHKDRYRKDQLGKVIWYAGGKIDWANVLASHIGVDEVDHGQYDKLKEIDFVTGAAMFVGKEVFEKIGFFDEKYFLYFEDLEFCQRAKKRGIKLIFSPKVLVWHKNAVSTKVGSPLQDYFITRNRLIFGFSYANLRSKFALARESLKFLFGPNQTKRDAVIDFYLHRLGRGMHFG